MENWLVVGRFQTSQTQAPRTCVPAARVALFHFLHPGFIPRMSKVDEQHQLDEYEAEGSGHTHVEPHWNKHREDSVETLRQTTKYPPVQGWTSSVWRLWRRNDRNDNTMCPTTPPWTGKDEINNYNNRRRRTWEKKVDQFSWDSENWSNFFQYFFNV